MSKRCIKPNEFNGLCGDDPHREHLKECQRCQAVLRSFRELAEMADVPAGREVVDAHARLMIAVYTVYENCDQPKTMQ